MSIVSLNTIKNWFKTGSKPTQAQFWDVWDSFRHKSEAVPYESIEGLDAVLLAQDVKINAIALPDDVIKDGEVYVSGTNVDILANDFIWRLLQVQYTNAALYHTVLPFSASGYTRTDIFVGTNLGTIYRVAGEERVGVAFKPSVPPGTIEIASVDVDDAVVGVPVIPKPKQPVTSVNGLRGDVVLAKSDIGLGNVDNTSDVNKPVSTAQQTALDLKLNSTDYNDRWKGKYLTYAALVSSHPTGNTGDEAQVNEVGSTDVVNYSWDDEESIWVQNGSAGSGATNTDALPEGSTNLYFTVARFLTNLTAANIKAALGITTLSGSNTGDSATPAETATTIGALIGGAADATPNGTDFIATSLTAGGILKKITWTNAKAFLKTYFDTLYAVIEPAQITITTAVSITTATLDSNSKGQSGKNTIIDNGVNAINITVNGGTAFVASYLKHGTGAITFVQGSGRTLALVDGTAVLNGAVGSTATISSMGTKDYLRISNV